MQLRVKLNKIGAPVKILLTIVFTCLTIWVESTQIPLFVYFSESHRVLFEEWFEPSLQEKDLFDLQVYRIEQVCRSGTHMENGWKEATQKKLELSLDMIERYWGEIIIYSDVDIQFFRPISEELLSLMEDQDFLIQKSNPKKMSCSGFYVVRANKATKNLFKRALGLMVRGVANQDEDALNRALNKSSFLKWQHLPDTYYCGGTLTGEHWHPGKFLPLPDSIVLHHANYTVGIVNKIKQFEYVRSRVL